MLEPTKDNDGKYQGGGWQLGKLGQGVEPNKNKDIFTDPDKNHAHWRLHEGENFAKVFYKTNTNAQNPTMASRFV